ncbi:hypothetical protein B0H19DRAFT_1324083 [Mycena capillaripes]|nr:hypothetical protein B0H19DRAFT_1324083 [Mycena capillaripes]
MYFNAQNFISKDVKIGSCTSGARDASLRYYALSYLDPTFTPSSQVRTSILSLHKISSAQCISSPGTPPAEQVTSTARRGDCVSTRRGQTVHRTDAERQPHDHLASRPGLASRALSPCAPRPPPPRRTPAEPSRRERGGGGGEDGERLTTTHRRRRAAPSRRKIGPTITSFSESCVYKCKTLIGTVSLWIEDRIGEWETHRNAPKSPHAPWHKRADAHLLASHRLRSKRNRVCHAKRGEKKMETETPNAPPFAPCPPPLDEEGNRPQKTAPKSRPSACMPASSPLEVEVEVEEKEEVGRLVHRAQSYWHDTRDEPHRVRARGQVGHQNLDVGWGSCSAMSGIGAMAVAFPLLSRDLLPFSCAYGALRLRAEYRSRISLLSSNAAHFLRRNPSDKISSFAFYPPEELFEMALNQIIYI